MLYEWLVKPYREIISYYIRSNTSSVILIQSNTGCGIKNLYLYIVKRILCLKPNNFISCNNCKSCNFIKENSHPDFFNILTKNYLKNTIGIDDVRFICKNLLLNSHLNKGKVILIENLEKLTNQASHALLKTLEEPTIKTYFILGCKNIYCILPSIISRSQIWKVIINKKDSLKWLEKKGHDVNSKKVIISLKLCNWSPVIANKIILSNFWKERKKLIFTLNNIFLKKEIAFSLLEYFKKIDMFFLILRSLILDTIKYNSNIMFNIINYDCFYLIKNISKNFSSEYLYEQWKFLLNFKKLKKEIPRINKEIFLIKNILDLHETIIKSGNK
ncbi:holB [Wigglesworthia glossinidia endosymbiont of Glossina brevipalpis]|uniref:DNA polymerase III subunit delta' n=1 Tax=Wigglesworthia glossinidia brevipalpis TaxID=36870 RepID=Q8D3A6_WIGBR|nr:holB [Wigglesworthia glossinidia endosymbiont of Glossina brevipalpis]